MSKQTRTAFSESTTDQAFGAMRRFVAAQLGAANPHLAVAAEHDDLERLCSANLTTHLQQTFAGVAFEATLSGKSGEQVAWVHWNDGPMEDAVFKACEIFSRGNTADGSADGPPNAWHLAFGSVRLVHPVRSYSDAAVEQVLKMLERKLGTSFASVNATACRWRNRSLLCHKLEVPKLGLVRAQSLVDYALSRSTWKVA